MSVHYSSATDLHETPQAFFDKLDAVYHFGLDPCTNGSKKNGGNAKCERYFTKAQDGLIQPWFGNVFMNPPYGREIGWWMKKANDEVANGNAECVVCLVPARTDTRWWHEQVVQNKVEFIRGRLKFGNAKNSAPFPSAVVIISKQAGIDPRLVEGGK